MEGKFIGHLFVYEKGSKMWIVVDTDKGGGMLVPIGGVIYENPEDALACYDKAVAEIYGGNDPYSAVQIFELCGVSPAELADV